MRNTRYLPTTQENEHMEAIAQAINHVALAVAALALVRFLK
jgi:hypothetical protein